MAQRKPPSRLRYEREHPNLTVRLPAAVKRAILEAAEAENLSVSAWIQQLVEARDEALDAFGRGRAMGLRLGGDAGLRVGLILAEIAHAEGRQYDVIAIARFLLAHPELREAAEELARRWQKADVLRTFLQAVAARR